MCFLQPLVATACGDIVTLLARKQHTTLLLLLLAFGAADSYNNGSGSLSMPERKTGSVTGPVCLLPPTPGRNLPFISKGREHWHRAPIIGVTVDGKHEPTRHMSARVNLTQPRETQQQQPQACCSNTAAAVLAPPLQDPPHVAWSRVTFNRIIVAAVFGEPL